MRAMLRTAVLALIALALSASPAAAHTINVGRFSVSSIGDFRPSTDPSIPAAERVFGPASSRRQTSNESCVVRWKRLRLEILFVSFGGGSSICSGSAGSAQRFQVRGKRFRTWHGLRVGQPERAVRRRHPAARLRQGTWWLKSAISPFGDPDVEFAVVDAKVRDGRVQVLRGWIGAAGD
jgi:hypothetical protein